MPGTHAALAKATLLVAILAGAIVARVAAQSSEQSSRTAVVSSDPVRLAEMQHHFLQVTRAHEALIRGDVNAVRREARELSTLPTPWRVPAAAMPYVEVLRSAAERLLVAETPIQAGDGVAVMLGLCGDCHQAVGVSPRSSSLTRRSDVGGMVGHMLEHEQAMDELLQGLVIPSATIWLSGSKRLVAAPLTRKELVPAPGVTDRIMLAEKQVHALATEAADATTSGRRAAVYGRLAATCAQCHGLHKEIWGPKR
jgi:mono/diheme cytochrome c family protein